MNTRELNWQFHMQVISKALDTLENGFQACQKGEVDTFAEKEIPLAINEARESLVALELRLSRLQKAASLVTHT